MLPTVLPKSGLALPIISLSYCDNIIIVIYHGLKLHHSLLSGNWWVQTGSMWTLSSTTQSGATPVSWRLARPPSVAKNAAPVSGVTKPFPGGIPAREWRRV